MFKNYEIKKQNEKLKEQITSLNYRINELQDREEVIELLIDNPIKIS